VSKTWDVLPSTEAEAKLIDDKIDQFNNSQVPFTQPISVPLNFNIKDNHNNLIAGVVASMYG
jgi:hypothetical protein